MKSTLSGETRPYLLLAEDDSILRSLLLKGLSWRFRISEFATASQTIEFINREQRPDAILTDFEFSEDCDGLSIVQSARAKHPNLPILLMTGSSTSAPRIEAALATPGVRLLEKPFSFTTVREALVNLVREAEKIEKLEVPLARLQLNE